MLTLFYLMLIGINVYCVIAFHKSPAIIANILSIAFIAWLIISLK